MFPNLPVVRLKEVGQAQCYYIDGDSLFVVTFGGAERVIYRLNGGILSLEGLFNTEFDQLAKGCVPITYEILPISIFLRVADAEKIVQSLTFQGLKRKLKITFIHIGGFQVSVDGNRVTVEQMMKLLGLVQR